MKSGENKHQSKLVQQVRFEISFIQQTEHLLCAGGCGSWAYSEVSLYLGHLGLD